MRVRGKPGHTLDLVKVNAVLLELGKDERAGVLDPKGLPFESGSFLKLKIVLNGVGDLATALRSLDVDRVIEPAGALAAESHNEEKSIGVSAR